MRTVLKIVLTVLLCPFPAHATEAISVDVGLGDITINKVPFLMAADNGIYEQNGLQVNQFITPSAAELARRSGVIVPPETIREDIDHAPLAVGGGSPAIYNAVYSAGFDPVVLLSLENRVQGHIIAASDIRTLDDLRGKRLGYSSVGRANHIGLLSFARRMGWMPGTDIVLVDGASTISDIQEGRADATLASAVLVALAPDAGLNDVVDLAEYDLPFAGSGVMAERGWLRANRDTAARFVKSALEALALLKSNRAAFDASIAKWLNITDAAAQDQLYAAAMGFPDKPYPSVEGIRIIMEIYDSPEMRARSAEDFYDASFIEELDRSGILDSLYR